MKRLDTCMLCPRLCRPACPVATGTWREAAVPTALATAIVQWRQGRWPEDLAREASTLCVGCGACTAHCHVHHPLADLLAEARSELLSPPSVEPIGIVEGQGAHLVIEADERPLAAALERHLDGGVRRLRTRDGLGAALVEFPAFEKHADQIRSTVGGDTPIVADGAVAVALRRAEIPFQWLTDLVDTGPVLGSCECAIGEREIACCGGAGPLAEHHPEGALDVGRRYLRDVGPVRLADARCRRHLGQIRSDLEDAIDAILAKV